MNERPTRLTAAGLKRLTSEWNRKLKESGFVDQEDHSGRLSQPVHFNDASRPATFSSAAFDAHEEYYFRASTLLHDHKFRDEVERQIWALHSEGLPHRQIATKLGIRYWAVQTTIASLAKLIIRKPPTESA